MIEEKCNNYTVIITIILFIFIQRPNFTCTCTSTMADNIYNLTKTGYASICLSVISVIICILVIILSFRKHGCHVFNWKIVQRFVVVCNICDALFYTAQATFGICVLITEEVPAPPMCSFYAVFLLVFAYAQCRLSMVIAIATCYLIMKKKHLNLGKYDWKMFLFMFLDPILVLSVAAEMGGMEFNGV